MQLRLLLLCFIASQAFAQEAATASPTPPIAATTSIISPNERFYKSYEITPMGNGDKVLIVLDGGSQQFNAVGAEPVPPKDGGPVTQWTLYTNGFVMLYSKKRIIIPNPSGGEGTPIDGMSVMNLSSSGPAALPTTPSPATFAGHQSSSKYTTPPRKDKDFKLPFRVDKAGFVGRPRVWLLWDGKKEIQVEPVDTNFKDTWRTLPGFGNHLKYLSNVYMEGSPAPRYFYMARNKDDSMTVYGDDDIDKLKAIEKAKGN